MIIQYNKNKGVVSENLANNELLIQLHIYLFMIIRTKTMVQYMYDLNEVMVGAIYVLFLHGVSCSI